MEKFIIILAAFVLCFAASHYAYIVGRYGRKRWLDRIVFKILFTFKAKNFKEYFKELAIYTSKPNWNDENDLPITQRTWDNALEVYLKVIYYALKVPDISPCGDGSAHIYLTIKGEKLTIEIKEDDYYCSVRSLDDLVKYHARYSYKDVCDKIVDFSGRYTK